MEMNRPFRVLIEANLASDKEMFANFAKAQLIQ